MLSQSRYKSPEHLFRVLFRNIEVIKKLYQNKDYADFTYDEVLEFFSCKNPERELDNLIELGTLVVFGENVSLSESLMKFLERELHENEVIQTSAFDELLKDIDNEIKCIRQSTVKSDKDKFITKAYRAFGGLVQINRENIEDLNRNVKDTYKYERNKDNKLLLLKGYQEKAKTMRLSMQGAIQFIEKRHGLIFDVINSPRLNNIVKEVRTYLCRQFGEFSRIEKTISIYVNRIEASNRTAKKLQKIARLIRQGTWNAATNIGKLIEENNDVIFETGNYNMTLPSIDWLSDTEQGLILIEKIREVNNTKVYKKKDVPKPFTDAELIRREDLREIPNVKVMVNAFRMSGVDLMDFLRNSVYMRDKSDKEIALMFLYVLGYATKNMSFTSDYSIFLDREFIKVYSK